MSEYQVCFSVCMAAKFGVDSQVCCKTCIAASYGVECAVEGGAAVCGQLLHVPGHEGLLHHLTAPGCTTPCQAGCIHSGVLVPIFCGMLTVEMLSYASYMSAGASGCS